MDCSSEPDGEGRYTITTSRRIIYVIQQFKRLPKPWQSRLLRLIDTMAAEQSPGDTKVVELFPRSKS